MFESLIISLRCQKVGQVRVQMTRGKKETPCGYGRWMMNRSRVAVTALVYTVWLWSWGIPFCMFECVREPDAECKELSVSFLYSRRIEKCSYVSIHGIAPFQNRMSQIKLPPINVLYLEWYYPSFLTSQLKQRLINRLQVIPLFISFTTRYILFVFCHLLYFFLSHFILFVK